MVKKVIYLFVFMVSTAIYLRPADESDLLVPANFNIEVIKQDNNEYVQQQEVIDLADSVDDPEIDEMFIDIVPISDKPILAPTKPTFAQVVKLVYRQALIKASEVNNMVYIAGLGIVIILSSGGFVVYKKYKNDK